MDVVRAAGGKADNEAHRPGRIGLRSRNAGRRRHCRNTRCQLQELRRGSLILNLPLTSDHSITSSARASTVVGTSRPSVLAVLRLIVSTYLVGACTGRSL